MGEETVLALAHDFVTYFSLLKQLSLIFPDYITLSNGEREVDASFGNRCVLSDVPGETVINI